MATQSMPGPLGLGGTGAGRPLTWRSAIVGGLVVWLAARVVVLAVSIVVLVVRSSPLTDPLGTRTPSPPGFFGVLSHWDSGYFLDIAQHGYFQPGAFSGLPALFPGYPMLARLLAAPFGGGVPATVAAMAVVSAVASMIAGVLIWRLAEVTGRPGAAPWAAALLLAGPYAVFLSANYAEALFCALAISAWYLALRDRWWWVAVLAGLAAVTRVNGLFLIAAFVVAYVLASRRAGLPLLRWQSLWPLVSVSGIAGYFVWLAVRTGDVFAWMTAQRIGWGREFHWPWSAFYQTAGRVLYASTLDRRFQFALDLLAGGALILVCVVYVRRRMWPEFTYVGATLLAMMTSFTFVSLARNSLTLFPVVLLLANELVRARPWVRAATATAWGGLFLINLTLFAAGYWTD